MTEGRTALVTGGNRGIGKEVVLGLVRAGAHVVLVSRSRERGEEAASEVVERARSGEGEGSRDIGSVEVMTADLSSQASIRELARGVRERHPALHLLVNNAAIVTPERSSTVDGLETQFAVNHLAPFLLTNLLLPSMLAATPARVVTVASEAHRRGAIRFDDLQGEKRYSGRAAYSASKLANVLFTRELARRLEGRGVTANAVHPGVIATHLLETLLGPFAFVAKIMLNAERGAAPVLEVALDPEIEGLSGAYFSRHRRARPSGAARSDEAARRLWTVSEELAGLRDVETPPESLA